MAHESTKLVRQQELLHLLLLRLPLKQCAERLNLSYVTVRKYAAEPDFLTKLKDLSESIYVDVIKELRDETKSLKQRLTEASDKALKKLEVLLESAQEGIALKAADSILDRNSESARNRKVEGDITNRFTIDPATLVNAAQTAIEVDQATFTPDASRKVNE